MKKIIFAAAAVWLMAVPSSVNAQTTAMQLNGMDCNGNSHDLFADLDAGKAVLLHFFMPSCGSCPPPAQQIQAMANRILAVHPGKITAYALPYNNTTTCSYTSSWVAGNGLSLYAPYDSGATQVAHYGGFGMPTVVLLGGKNHRVMFSTLSFSASDTTIMRDSIMALISSTGISDQQNTISEMELFPNPAAEKISVNIRLKERSAVLYSLTDLTGKTVLEMNVESQPAGIVNRSLDTGLLPPGIYFLQVKANEAVLSRKINISR